ncbi:MAG: hypothetical protein ACOH2V_14215 [Candidatus Saccharimonadaceae bacterium]
MTIDEFITNQSLERQDLLSKIHSIIIQEDKSVEPKIGTMMGKEMILYNTPWTFKYGLSSVKNYISLHAMPIYASTMIHSKYKSLLHKAIFQKGCINFRDEKEMPLEILRMLIADCSKVDFLAIREEYLKSRKK